MTALNRSNFGSEKLLDETFGIVFPPEIVLTDRKINKKTK